MPSPSSKNRAYVTRPANEQRNHERETQQRTNRVCLRLHCSCMVALLVRRPGTNVGPLVGLERRLTKQTSKMSSVLAVFGSSIRFRVFSCRFQLASDRFCMIFIAFFLFFWRHLTDFGRFLGPLKIRGGAKRPKKLNTATFWRRGAAKR